MVSSVLKDRGTVIYPSDTVYGIMADASSRKAVDSVAAIKGYTAIRPFIVIVEDITRALELTSKKNAKQIMEEHWPGPVTLILPASHAVPKWLTGDSGAIALRIPSDRLSQKILKHSGLDLVTTSANKKSESFSNSISTIPKDILEAVSMILDGGALPVRNPSRIIDYTKDNPVEVR